MTHRYLDYKPSGVQWLGDIPSHWELIQIKRVIKEHSGNGFPVELQGNNGDVPFLKVSDLNKIGKILTNFNNSVNKDMIFENKWNVVPAFSLVTAKIGEALRKNHRKIIETDVIIDNNCIAFECINIEIKYHYYLTLMIDFDWFENGGTVPSLSVFKYKNQKICLPPPDEQTAIAKFLDCETAKIDALLQKQAELLAKLSEQRTALITHAVTKGLNPNVAMKNSGVQWLGDIPSHWEIIKNKFILNFSKGLSITKENLIDDGIPCVNYGEIHSKYGFEVIPEKHYLKCVPESYLENAQNALLKNGDFVFADTSEDIKGSGNFTYLNSDTPTFAGYHTIIARLKSDDVCSRFLAYVFSSEMHRNQVRAIVKGVKVFSITQAFLKNTYVYFPPIDEQTAIAEFLDCETAKIDALCDKIREMSERLTEYRTTLISDAVTGKIKVIP